MCITQEPPQYSSYMVAIDDFNNRHRLPRYSLFDYQKVFYALINAVALVYNLDEDEFAEDIAFVAPLPEEVKSDFDILVQNLVDLIQADVEPHKAAKTIVKGYLRRRWRRS